MFRAPRVLKTHATAPPAGAAVSSSGNGALITCSTVKVDCCAGSAAGTSRVRVRQRSDLVMVGVASSVEPRRPPEQPAGSAKQRQHRRGETRDPSPAEGQLGYAGHHPEPDEGRGSSPDQRPIEPAAAAGGHARAFSGECGANV